MDNKSDKNGMTEDEEAEYIFSCVCQCGGKFPLCMS